MRVKSQDAKASQIRWGIELETRIPTTAGVNVGGYHRGHPIQTGIDEDSRLRPIAWSRCRSRTNC